MKKLLLLFVFAIAFNTVNAQSAKPTKEETYSYIRNILMEADGFTITYGQGAGAVYKISVEWDSFFSLKNGYYWVTATNSDLECFGKNMYSKIDLSKLIGEPEDDNIGNVVSSSSIKKLKLTFKANSVLYQKYGTCITNINEIPTSTVTIFYRNEEGVKERLVKAIMYLNKLLIAEKSTDPFDK